MIGEVLWMMMMVVMKLLLLEEGLLVLVELRREEMKDIENKHP